MNKATFTSWFLIADFLIAMMTFGGVFRFPNLWNGGSRFVVFLTLFMLVVYGAAMVWLARLRSLELPSTWRIGLVIGAVFMILMSIENFTNLNGGLLTMSTLGFMFLIFLLFAIAGWFGAKRKTSIAAGILSSIVSAMIGVMIALLFGFAINFLFNARLEQNLQNSPEFLRSSIHDLATFTFYNTLDSASTHLVEVPLLAVLFGSIGSLLGKYFT